MTKVFISWSGEPSKQLAEALREWLPGALQFVKPYFTPEDIEKGTRWGSDIIKELESSDVGLLCLTNSNTSSPWILFEAGALSKSLEKARVYTVLFGIETTDLKGPLTIFQHTRFQKEDFRKLVKSVNNAGGDAKLEDSVFNSVFEMWWPKLEQKINLILNAKQGAAATENRSERDLLEEILELTRIGVRSRRPSRDLPASVVVEIAQSVGVFLRQLPSHRRHPELMNRLRSSLLALAEYSDDPEVMRFVHEVWLETTPIWAIGTSAIEDEDK